MWLILKEPHSGAFSGYVGLPNAKTANVSGLVWKSDRKAALVVDNEPFAFFELDVAASRPRSTARLYDDFVFLKMPFASFASAHYAKQERALARPAPEEFDEGLGCLSCAECGLKFISGIEHVDHAPNTPWTALAPSLTCVAREEYLGEGGDAAFQTHAEKVSRNTVQLTELSVKISPQSCAAAVVVDSSVRVGDRIGAACAGCGALVGLLAVDEEFNDSLCCELFKHSLKEFRSATTYPFDAVLGFILRYLTFSHDSRSFLINKNLKIDVLSTETWIKTDRSSSDAFASCLKVAYCSSEESFRSDDENDRELLFLPTKLCERITSRLKRSSMLLPKSARRLDASRKIGFVFA